LLQEAFPVTPRWARIGSLYALVMGQDLNADERTALSMAWKHAGMAGSSTPPWRSILNDSFPQPTNGLIGGVNPTEVTCWAVFQFLASSEPNRRVLRALLEPPPAGARSVSGSASRLEHLYPGGGARFEEDFKQWLARQELNRQQ
jgi:hypothetical protein